MEYKNFLDKSSTKVECLNISIQLTSNWGKGGSPHVNPAQMLQTTYAALVELLDKVKEDK
jgi:hypothetical protein